MQPSNTGEAQADPRQTSLDNRADCILPHWCLVCGCFYSCLPANTQSWGSERCLLLGVKSRRWLQGVVTRVGSGPPASRWLSKPLPMSNYKSKRDHCTQNTRQNALSLGHADAQTSTHASVLTAARPPLLCVNGWCVCVWCPVSHATVVMQQKRSQPDPGSKSFTRIRLHRHFLPLLLVHPRCPSHLHPPVVPLRLRLLSHHSRGC